MEILGRHTPVLERKRDLGLDFHEVVAVDIVALAAALVRLPGCPKRFSISMSMRIFRYPFLILII